MNSPERLADLARLGIQLEVQCDHLRYRLQSAVTLDLVDRMKAHKIALLAMLQPEAANPGAERPDALAAWQAALDLLEGDPNFPPDVMNSLRAADVRWADDQRKVDRVGDDLEVLDLSGPCDTCGQFESWWKPLGERRCINCYPPDAAIRLIERVE